MNSNKLDYNLNWHETFTLDRNSPSGLIRIRSRFNKTATYTVVGHKSFQSVKSGGSPRGWQLTFKRKMYYVHRIIWVMTYGSIDPKLVIDHLDGNPFNNSIENLSLKTHADNMRNRNKPRNSTTSFTGVRLRTNGHGGYFYQASWVEITGKLGQKSFSISKLGAIEAERLAIECREQQIQRLILEGAEYTERHGSINNEEIK